MTDPPFQNWLPGGRGGDVLSLARTFDCTVLGAVQSLLRHLRPPPRAIHLVVADNSCAGVYGAVPPGKLHCYHESQVLPFNVSAVEAALVALKARTRYAGWFFQQFIKLGFAFFSSISTDFLVWDSDAVLLAPYAPVDSSRRLVVLSGGHFMPQYGAMHLDLLNTSLRSAPDGSSLVVHQALFRTPWVGELLQRLTPTSCDRVPAAAALLCRSQLGWAWRVLQASRGRKAFSEYAFYLSHVLTAHAEQPVLIVHGRRRRWCRSPLRAAAMICPDAYAALTSFAAERARGVLYVTFEASAKHMQAQRMRAADARPVPLSGGSLLDALQSQIRAQVPRGNDSLLLQTPRGCRSW